MITAVTTLQHLCFNTILADLSCITGFGGAPSESYCSFLAEFSRICLQSFPTNQSLAAGAIVDQLASGNEEQVKQAVMELVADVAAQQSIRVFLDEMDLNETGIASLGLLLEDVEFSLFTRGTVELLKIDDVTDLEAFAPTWEELKGLYRGESIELHGPPTLGNIIASLILIGGGLAYLSHTAFADDSIVRDDIGTVRLLGPNMNHFGLDQYRSGESEKLRETVQQAIEKDGEEPTVILVAGHSGAGKSTAIDRAVEGVRDEVSVWSPDLNEAFEAKSPVTIIDMTVVSEREMASNLGRMGVRPDNIVFFHPKPLSPKQIKEANERRIQTTQIQVGRQSRVFFRDPLPAPNISSSARDKVKWISEGEVEPILYTLLHVRVRHPGISTPEPCWIEDLNQYQHAVAWYKEFGNILGNDDEDFLCRLLSHAHRCKDWIALSGFLNASLTINGIRVLAALFIWQEQEPLKRGGQSMAQVFSSFVQRAGLWKMDYPSDVHEKLGLFERFEGVSGYGIAGSQACVEAIVEKIVTLLSGSQLDPAIQRLLDFIKGQPENILDVGIALERMNRRRNND